MEQPEGQLEILKKGYLIYKKTHKVFVMLCAPISITDVSTIYHSLFPGKEGIQNRAAVLGNIAYAAMEETPVMILLQSEKNVTRPNFVHFIDVISVEDEVDIGAACSIRIKTKDHMLYFSATTSTEYQGWINAFQEAYSQAHSNDEYHNEMEEAIDGIEIPELANRNNNNNPNRGLSQSFPRSSTISSSSINHRISIFSDISTSPDAATRNGVRKNSEPLFGRLFNSCKNPDPDMQNGKISSS
ncbi:hypothetical protein H8356DRAFT_1028806 [Neocallimastix lanati (nom. inval.)]|jgi:hypothetical protein|uniref:PH domain-containing protein n=1 Tax=Neocallimastix californiae TaxID=1754190 RepID=A0A1Y2DRC2_9FUNG|nr:hypothetical protein H8356DRAFT_1028806 [Neocallimastix sp. JGI-2020a]ORY61833.1 hypothetical protein LY90DRAFT_668478 [Neocallimastix californiae]|eukprot:ORY61833.1 hypothetical protein LY90DRAFT_668478 [Neocallimastix californiae]